MDGNFLSGLAVGGPFVIANETLYQVCEKRDSRDYGNVMTGEGFELGLVPSGRIKDIELFHRSRNIKGIFDYKKKFVQDGLQRELMSGQDIQNYDDVKCALKFILEEFLPLMIDTAYEMGELLGVPNTQGVKTGRQCIDDIVREEVEIIDKGDPVERIKRAKMNIEKQLKPREKILRWEKINADAKPEYNGDTSTLGYFTDQVPIYFSRGHVFVLTPKLNNVVFVIDGKKYSPMKHSSIASFDKAYYEEFLNALKAESIQEFDAQSEQTIKDSKQERGFQAFAGKKSFSYGNLGYIRQGDAFYVYWEIPKFAMQNPVQTKMCNPYPPTKVSLKINASRGQVFRSKEAFCIDPMIHPTLHDWTTHFSKICNLSGNFRGHSAKNAMADLSDGINSFINGLTMESLIQHGARDESCAFYGVQLKDILQRVGYLTLEDAMAQGYKITNVWNHKEYREALTKVKGVPVLEDIAKEPVKDVVLQPVVVPQTIDLKVAQNPEKIVQTIEQVPEDDLLALTGVAIGAPTVAPVDTPTANPTPAIEIPVTETPINTTPKVQKNRLQQYYERTIPILKQCGKSVKKVWNFLGTDLGDMFKRDEGDYYD